MLETISLARPVHGFSKWEPFKKSSEPVRQQPLGASLHLPIGSPDTPVSQWVSHSASMGDSVHFSGANRSSKRRRGDEQQPQQSSDDPIESSSDDEAFPPLPPLKDPKGQPPMNALLQLMASSSKAQANGAVVDPAKLMAGKIERLQPEGSGWESYKTVAEPYAKQLGEILNRPYLHHVVLQGNNEQLEEAIMMTLKEKAADKSFVSVDCSDGNLHEVQDHYEGPALVNAFAEPARSLRLPVQKPTVIFLKNADDDELADLQNNKLFQWIPKENPHFRFIVSRPAKAVHSGGENEIKISLGGLFGNSKAKGAGSQRAPFDVVTVPALDAGQWAAVLPQDAKAKAILKHWQLECSPETLSLFLKGLPAKNGDTLDRETILGRLDQLGGFIRQTQNQPAGPITATQVNQFLNTLALPAFTKSVKTGPLSSDPMKQKPYKIIKATDIKTRLDDVVGMEDAKKVLNRVLKMMNFPQFNAHLSKGDVGAQNHRVLLMGEPGGGKTMLAEAIAAQGKGTFISTTGSQFVNVFVGMGANNMRQLQSAIDNVTDDMAVVFFDEIDSLGMRESGSRGGGAREETQTINEFLALTEGIEKDKKKILLIGATNRPEALDKAILSRFHHKIEVGKLIGPQRKLLFQKQMEQKKMVVDQSVDLNDVVRLTDGFSGRDIRNVLKLCKEVLIDNMPDAELEKLEKNPALLKDFKLTLTADVLHQAIADIKKGWANVENNLNPPPTAEVLHSLYT